MFGMNQHDNAKLRGLHPANAAGVGEHFMQHLCKATCITAQSGISKPASAFAFSLRGCQDSLMQLPLHAKMPDMRSCAMSAATLSSAWAVQTIRHSCRRSSSCPTLGASLGRLDRRQGTSLSGASQVVTDLKLNPCTGSSMRICSLPGPRTASCAVYRSPHCRAFTMFWQVRCRRQGHDAAILSVSSADSVWLCAGSMTHVAGRDGPTRCHVPTLQRRVRKTCLRAKSRPLQKLCKSKSWPIGALAQVCHHLRWGTWRIMRFHCNSSGDIDTYMSALHHSTWLPCRWAIGLRCGQRHAANRSA